MINKMYFKYLAYPTATVFLFSAGWFAHESYYKPVSGTKFRHATSERFYFTSPLLDVELPEGVIINQEPIPFKSDVSDLVKNMIEQGNAREISVYYRDLHDGPWFGINENMSFNPASMMKVPVMVAWLKRAEKDPVILKHRLMYDDRKRSVPVQDISPDHSISPGESYTIEELLHYMIKYSDNRATALLYDEMRDDEQSAVLENMDVKNDIVNGVNTITVHGYSGFFRILYNASYLNHDMSEKALALLSLQDFPQGIVAGVPHGISVASKFGEYGQPGGAGTFQLHEFGIVYHPAHPYILGIMTRGNDKATLAAVLRDISRLIYSKVDSAYRKNDY